VGYALGPTGVDLWEFTYATSIGMMPGCLLYSWIGVSMHDLTSDSSESTWSAWLSIGISVISTIVISYQAKKIFDEATKEKKTKKN
jgi:uncharacterized membrane protein YdjX (TVP38/TMEM64 family)